MKKAISCFMVLLILCTPIFAEMKQGQLNIIAKKGVYKVFLDEVAVGETPLKLQNVIAGNHLLRVVDPSNLRTLIDKSVLVKPEEVTTVVVEEGIVPQLTNLDYSSKQYEDKMINLSLYNSERKEPGLAAFLSFLIVGGGQIYNGAWGKFGAMILVTAISWSVYSGAKLNANRGYGSQSQNESQGTTALLIYLATWLYSMFDAYAEATDINDRLKTKYGISSLELVDISKYSLRF